jgi:hypothetical protein
MDDDLKDVMDEDKRRGKRPVDLDERRRRKQLVRGFKMLLQRKPADEDQLKSGLRALGMRDGSQEFVQCVRFWMENREL